MPHSGSIHHTHTRPGLPDSPGIPHYLRVSPSSQGSDTAFSPQHVTNQVNPQPATTYVPAISCHGLTYQEEGIPQNHTDVFQALSKFAGQPLRLYLKEGYMAASRGIHKVPIHMEKRFAEEVENMDESRHHHMDER